MTVKVTCLGGAVLDLIYGVDELPHEDGKSIARSFAESGGGMAANAAVIVSRLGGQAIWCGRVGDDDKGRRILDGLRLEKVDVRTAKVVSGIQSSHSIVLKDRIGNRAIILYRSEALEVDPSWLPLEKLLVADAVLADNRWIEGAVALLSAARARGIPAVLDADSAGDDTTLKAVSAASHVVFSAPGLASLFKTKTPEEGLRRAQKHAPFVAVTLGSKGVLWLDESGAARHVPSFPVAAVETVGAGDIFHGAFAFALGRGQSEEDGLRFAAAAAAIKCAGEGGTRKLPAYARRRSAFGTPENLETSIRKRCVKRNRRKQ
ncbi:sugar kinase (plasmid) [Rhizobium sp. RCAM05350]|uniref:sugar kinase n=1 Tax=Rhizobium sp. RCAM05350 TaxID=2895568 RepID=UPI002076AD55|nr:sugar kinase [Rhizobium sp. RCAM05350]URK89446.1 sugar kinase [Rhizobium sp. RCAM05350]